MLGTENLGALFIHRFAQRSGFFIALHFDEHPREGGDRDERLMMVGTEESGSVGNGFFKKWFGFLVSSSGVEQRRK